MIPEQRDAIIAEYDDKIAELEEDIAQLERGDLQIMSRRPDGMWVDANDRLIAQDRHTIEVYLDIIRRYRDGTFN
jgi:hypothetical protein